MKALKKLLLFAISVTLYGIACAQSLIINKIDIYGNRKISSAIILSHINIKEGDNIDPAVFKPDTIISVIKKIPGIKHVTAEPLCCDTENGFTLYIGIAESNSAILKYRAAESVSNE